MRTLDTGYRLLLGAIAVALAVGFSALVWYTVPDVLGQPGTATAAATTRVEATVIQRVGCDADAPRQRVQFTLDGKKRDAAINRCGDEEGTKLSVLVPDNLDSASPTDVVPAESGTNLPLSGSRGLALLLLVLAGAAGAGYAFLVSGKLGAPIPGGPGAPGSSGGAAGGRPSLPRLPGKLAGPQPDG